MAPWIKKEMSVGLMFEKIQPFSCFCPVIMPPNGQSKPQKKKENQNGRTFFMKLLCLS